MMTEISNLGSEIDTELYEWVSVREAAIRVDKTEKTIYNRINSGVLKSRENDGKTEVWIRKVSEAAPEMVQAPFRSHSNPDSNFYRIRYEEIQNQLQNLQTELQEARIEHARLEGEVKRIPELERIIEAMQKTIRAHEMANDAMHNERIVITNQLQKYRKDEHEAPVKAGFKWFWQT